MKVKTLILICLMFAFALGAHGHNKGLKSKWAKYEGARIHYYDVGPGKKEAIIFIHGWTCSADFWKASISEFPGYRAIAIDLPGHGKSDKPQTNYTMEYFARSIEAVMKMAGIKRAVLVGHSMGTPVIRQFYRIFPEQTLGLVIVDGALRAYAPRAALEKFIAPLRSDFQKNGPPMVDGMLAPMKDEAMKKMIRETMLAAPGYVAASAMDGMADDAIWREDQISVPVLAIMDGSGQWPADNSEFYKKIAPKIDYQKWSDVTHFLFMERPKGFNDAVKDFIVKNKLL